MIIWEGACTPIISIPITLRIRLNYFKLSLSSFGHKHLLAYEYNITKTINSDIMDQSRLDTLEQDWRPILAAVAKVLEQPQAFVKEDHNVAMARVKAVSGFGERCGLPVCLNLIKADQQMVLCKSCQWLMYCSVFFFI